MNKTRYILVLCTTVILCIELIPGNIWFFEVWCGLALGGLINHSVEIFVRYNSCKNFFKSLDINAGVKIKNNILLGLVGTALLSVVSIFVIIPTLVSEHTHKDMLVSSLFQSISISPIMNDEKVMASFKDIKKIQKLIKRAKVYYPSHVSGSRDFVIELLVDGNKLIYQADILDERSGDVRFSYKNLYYSSNILVPGLGELLIDGLYLNDT